MGEASIRGLELEGATVVRDGRRVFADLGLSVAPGEILWVEGESGTGKSTLLRALARLVPLESGRLRLDGQAASEFPPHRWRATVTLLSTPPVPLGPTVREDLLAPHGLRERRQQVHPDDRDFERELEALGLGEVALERSPSQLSQGQLARVALVRTLCARPRVLLLDEPTANLDPGSSALVAARVHSYVGQAGMAVVAAHAAPWPGVTRRLRLRGGREEGPPP